ncbi:hypothetical protein MMC09_005054 [Bachmanniomyces sp. S44760]|nr:hypothetical protein [Bachmanniomyces sp. S44760]
MSNYTHFECLSQSDPNVLWNYCPNLGAAIAFAVLFGLVTAAHITQAIMFRKGFCWVIAMSALWQCLGYIFRSLSIWSQATMWSYTAQFILILLAPLWTNAFCYMILGRMIHLFLPGQSVLRFKPRKLALWFVLLDITAFLIQAAGASIASGGPGTSQSSLNNGLHIYMAGIGMQQAFIVAFLALAIRFHYKVLRTPNSSPTNWKALLYAVYTVLTLITIRIIFRMCEYSSGVHGKLLSHEVYPFVLDALPMIVALVIFNVVHPGKTLVGPDSEFQKRSHAEKDAEKRAKIIEKKEKKERKQQLKDGQWQSPVQVKSASEGSTPQRNESYV